jgi:hypothetical protein
MRNNVTMIYDCFSLQHGQHIGSRPYFPKERRTYIAVKRRQQNLIMFYEEK